MNKRNGFTLIELLAVIVILAVIALIATPIIMGVINDSKKGANKESARGYITAALYSLSKIDKELKTGGTYTINNSGNLIKDNIEYKIDVKGKRPTSGAITFNTDGKVGAALLLDNTCYVKYLTKEDITIIEDNNLCDEKISSNLVVNGYGEHNNNFNFSSVNFDSKTFYTKTTADRITFGSDEFIPVDSSKTYEQKMDLKATNNSATHFVGIYEYDIDFKPVQGRYVMFTNNSLTTLTKDLKDGDTTVYFDDLSSFSTSSSLRTYQLGFISWNYKDSTGYLYPEHTYSRNVWTDLYLYTGINKNNNTITLKEPWNKGTIKAGTKLSQSNDGATFNYGVILHNTLPKTFITKNNILKGTIKNTGEINDGSFRPGTRYVKIYVSTNYNKIGSNSISIKNVSLRQIN